MGYNRIVLIGNGFDLALGLKTSYADFFLDYLKEATPLVFPKGYEETALFSLETKPMHLTNPPEYYIKEINRKQSVKELLDFMELIIEIRYKYTFMNELVNELIDAKWVDIEQYYYSRLLAEFASYKINPTVARLRKIKKLNKCMDDLSHALQIFIIKQQDAGSVNYGESNMFNLIHKIREPLTEDKLEFVMENHGQDHPSEILYLNFNYTDTVQHLIGDKGPFSKKDNSRHLHIHGSVDDKENPIIFGYGDDTAEEYHELEMAGENELLRMIKSFKYPRANNYHKLLGYIEEDYFDVFIVGHSCGLSDKTLLKTIFEHKHCIAIQNFHRGNESEDFEKRIQISRHFSDKVLMRERLLPFDQDALIPQA